MRTNLLRLLCFLLACAPVGAVAQSAPAASVYGQIALAAATAMAITMEPGTCAYSVQNLDSNPIYIGSDATVNATNFGRELAPWGTTHDLFTVTLTYQSAALGTTIWIYSTAGTATATTIHFWAVC